MSFSPLPDGSAAAPGVAPSAAALRSAVRPLLRALCRRPGALYQPVYIGPVAAPETVSAEAQSVADHYGLPAVFALGADAASPLPAGARGVVVVGVEEAEAWVHRATAHDVHAVAPQPASRQQARWPVVPPGQQVIICGSRPATALPEALRAWLGQGLEFDPSALATALGGEWSMGPTLARCAQQPGRLYNPVLLASGAGMGDGVASEAMLRLEVNGLQPVLRYTGAPRPSEPALARLGEGSGVVIQLAKGLPTGEAGAAFRATVESLLARHIQVVVVGDQSSHETVRQDERWRFLVERGISLVVAAPAEAAPVGGATREMAVARVAWPPLADVLVGPPDIGAEPPRIGTGQTPVEERDGLLLGDYLQTLFLGRQTGRLVVYAHDRLGMIELVRGAIVHAQVLGDHWDLPRLQATRGARDTAATPAALASALVQDRVCRIGTWPRVRYVFMGRQGEDAPADERVTLTNGSALVMRMSQLLDEGPRRARAHGGLARKWQRAARPPVGLPATTTALWEAVDGVTMLDDVAHRLGLFDDEALEAAAVLAEAGAIAPADEGHRGPLTAAHEVAAELLRRGLVTEAQHVLREAEREASLTAGGWFLLGHLSAIGDPQAATAAFLRAALPHTVMPAGAPSGPGVVLPDARVVGAALNAALLQVRGRQAPADAAWQAVAAVVRGAQPEALQSVRAYAAIIELAARGGDHATARQVLHSLRQSRSPDAERLAAALADVATLGG